MSQARRTPVVPLRAGAGPENPPCPACGEPLFGWIDARPGLAGPVSRCESCGLGVVGAPGNAEDALRALRAGEDGGTIEIANRAGFSAWVGGAGWAGLEPGSRYLFTTEAVRRLAAGRDQVVRSSRWRPGAGIATMWQTVLNGFTFGRNVALGALGRGEPARAERAWQRRLDALISVVVAVLAFGVAAVIACSNGMGAWGLVIGFYAGAVADVLLSWALVRWRPRLRQASMAMWRELIGYGRFVLASNVLMRAGEQVPVILLGRYVGTGALGQLRYADRMTSTPLALIVQAASYVLFPAFARITDDRERFRAATLRSLQTMCALAFPLGMLLVPLGVPAAVLLFGEVWRDAGEAAIALIGIPVAGTVVSFASEAFKADGRPDLLARLHVVSVLATSIAVVALLPFDLIGVAAGISVGLSAAAAYGITRSARMIGLPAGATLRAIAAPAAAALVMVAAMTPLEFLAVEASERGTALGLCLLAAEALAGLAVYAGALALISPRTAGEIRDLAGRILLRRGRAA